MGFKTYVINIFKKLYDQIENLSRELKSIKVNQMKILILKLRTQ